MRALRRNSVPPREPACGQGRCPGPGFGQNADRGAGCGAVRPGMPLMNKDGLRAKGTKNIIRRHGGNRRSGGWSACPGLAPATAGTCCRSTIESHLSARHAPALCRSRGSGELVKDSPLDWVIVRPASFVERRAYRCLPAWFHHGDAPSSSRFPMRMSPTSC